MSQPGPDATSTPTSVPRVTGRKGIKDNKSIQSPIDLEFPTHQYETRSRTSERIYESSLPPSPKMSPKWSLPPESFANQESESDQYSNGEDSPNSDAPSYGDHSKRDSQQSQNNGSKLPLVLGCLAVLVVAAKIVGYTRTDDATSEPDIQEKFMFIEKEFMSIEKEFPNQDLDFWRTIRVNIKEISVLDQPKTIMFLYNNKAEKNLNKILKRVSEIGVCHLRKCSDKPVIIEGASLNRTEIVNDYGKIISKYRNDLEKNGVMVIKNLEKVPGKSAQAFHSYCDDYNPVVKHALILFTVKVENLPQGYVGKFIEDFLLKLWNDIGRDDKFYPLFTRITGTVLSVRPE